MSDRKFLATMDWDESKVASVMWHVNKEEFEGHRAGTLVIAQYSKDTAPDGKEVATLQLNEVFNHEKQYHGKKLKNYNEVSFADLGLRDLRPIGEARAKKESG